MKQKENFQELVENNPDKIISEYRKMGLDNKELNIIDKNMEFLSKNIEKITDVTMKINNALMLKLFKEIKEMKELKDETEGMSLFLTIILSSSTSIIASLVDNIINLSPKKDKEQIANNIIKIIEEIRDDKELKPIRKPI